MAISELSCNSILRKVDEEQGEEIYTENYIFLLLQDMADVLTDLVSNNICIVSNQLFVFVHDSNRNHKATDFPFQLNSSARPKASSHFRQ